jgi:hypothetical protein
MFDQVFSKICNFLQYQVNVIKILMKYTSILYTFGIVYIGDFCYVLGQSL